MLKKLSLFLCIFVSMGLGFVKAVSTPVPSPYPTSVYTCIQNKNTCVTDNGKSCYKQTSGTCPRGEVCCKTITNPNITIAPTPQITPFRGQGVILDRYNRCFWEEKSKEYHPLRPFPASPCAAHLIPNKFPEAKDRRFWQTYSCGKSANPEAKVTAPGVVEIPDPLELYPYSKVGALLPFDHIVNGQVVCPPGLSLQDAIACQHFKQAHDDPSHQSYPIPCDDFASSHNVCFLARIIFNLQLDYTDAIFPILGNTTDLKLTDRTKLNNYLSWYLNGAVLQSENKNLNTSKVTDEDRLINFSGPVKKLLSQESMQQLRDGMVRVFEPNDIHNYSTFTSLVGSDANTNPFFEFATEEDIMSEVQPALIWEDQPHQPEINGQIVSIDLRVGSADSRIYFPHLKNSVAMSEYLTATYKPVDVPQIVNPVADIPDRITMPDGYVASVRRLIAQRFSLLQGFYCAPFDKWGNPAPITDPCQNIFQEGAAGDATKVYFEWFPDPKMIFADKYKLNYRTISRNTEVFPNGLAPAPLFLNYSDRFPSISTQRCDIKPSIGGQGDSLIGGKINTTVTIYQAFKYQPNGLIFFPQEGWRCSDYGLGPNTSPQCKDFGDPPPTGCSAIQGGTCQFSLTGDGTCCYGKCPPMSECEMSGGTCWNTDPPGSWYPTFDSCDPTHPVGECWKQTGVTPKPQQPKCGSWPLQDLQSKGRVAIYLKVPFVEKLYDILVESPNSLMRRFLPYNAGKPTPTPPLTGPIPTNVDFLKTGNQAIVGEGSAKYTAVADQNSGATVKDVSLTAGSGGSPTLYFPKIGSLFEYLLGAGKDPLNLQCILRPQGACPTPKPPLKCGELPVLPKGTGSCSLGQISSRVGDIPQSLKDIIEAAAQAFDTPPNLILAQMYGEGVFNPGRFDWTDDNVKNWATCEKIPDCNETGEDNFIGFNGDYFATISNLGVYKEAMSKLDPPRTEFSQCNLLDSIFAAAYNLHDSADGSPFFKNPATGIGYTCLGITLNTGTNVPTSCSWDDSQYESAIRISEFGTGWGATSLGFYTCATKNNSCFLGGGPAAQCPTDTATNPDTCPTSGNNSHNLCYWEVAHGI